MQNLIFLYYLVFIIISLINSYLDIRTFRLSLILNYCGFFICFLLNLFLPSKQVLNHILGSFILFILFILVRKITHNKLGGGDVHYSLFCGLVAGIPDCFFSAFLAAAFGLIVFVIIKLSHKRKDPGKIKIPFIPMLFLGTIAAIVYRKMS